MGKTTLLKMMLLNIFILGSLNLFGQTTYILQDDFSSISSGNNTSTSGSSTAWTGDTPFPTVSSAYQAGGVVKLGTSSAIGSITSKALDLSVNGGSFSVSFDVKGWTTVEGDITVTATGLTGQTVTYTAVMSNSSFENKVLNFTGGTANSTIKIATTAKRAFIDNVNIYYVATTPTIALTETTVPNLAASVGGEDPQTINVSGLNLAGNIMLSITGTNYNQFEVTPSLLSQSGGIVNNTPITFKYKPTVTGTHTATLEVASIGAPTITKVLSGTATPTGINDVRIQDLSAFNGKIKFIAEGGENIEVYNSIGQKIINQTAVNGQNTIDLPNVKGMAIVKVGNKTAKVVL